MLPQKSLTSIAWKSRKKMIFLRKWQNCQFKQIWIDSFFIRKTEWSFPFMDFKRNLCYNNLKSTLRFWFFHSFQFGWALHGFGCAEMPPMIYGGKGEAKRRPPISDGVNNLKSTLCTAWTGAERCIAPLITISILKNKSGKERKCEQKQQNH